MGFEFATAHRIIFGSGSSQQVGKIAGEYGKNAFVITRKTGDEGIRKILKQLTEAGIDYHTHKIEGEPSIKGIEAGVAEARQSACDLVIAIGGGSVLDSGKAIAAMLTNPGEVLDYLEVIGRGKTIPNPSAAFIAIPTTAGTGSEVTRNAVITSDDGNVKASLRSPFMLPRAAIVDPELTLGLPPEVTASTGMDALAQVLEPFVCKRANPMTDLYCREGLSRAATALQAAYRNGDNLEARCQMSWASLLGGLSLANAGLGAVHGFAAPLGGLYKAPHGALCAVLLAGVVRGNVQALRAREAQNPVLDRFLEIAKILTQNPAASIEDGITWLEALTKELHIPSLSKYGVVRKDFKLIIEKALQASSMKANPIALTEEELERILAESLDL